MGVPGRRRQAQEEVAEAARRRLELLGRELDRAGLRRLDDVDAAGPDTAPGPGGDPGALLDDPGDATDDDVPPWWGVPTAHPLGAGRRVGAAGTPESSDPLPAPRVVPPAGRHLRPARAGAGERLRGWLGDQVPETFRGRVGLGPGPVLLVVALVALALVVTGVVVLRSGDPGQAVPARPAAGSAAPLVGTAPGASSSGSPSTGPGATPASSGASATGSSTPAAAPGGGGATVTVDVAGKVRRPGVATLPAGSRVVDAVRRAGGARGRVDLTSLNLARVLVDGEQILVGTTGSSATGGAAAGSVAGAPPAGGAPSASAGALVNLNTATLDQLDTLPGVGPVTAQKILDWRTAHGAFSSVDELLEVDGIGEKTLADLAPRATL